MNILQDMHLHSTMLLLYPIFSGKGMRCTIIYIPLCFYFIDMNYLLGSSTKTNLHSTMLLLYQVPFPELGIPFPHLHSTMLLLYPVSFFSPYFLLFRSIFCPPSFLFIFPLQKHPCQISKMQFYLDSSSFVYLLEILHYFKSTITESCSFYHHLHPRTL